MKGQQRKFLSIVLIVVLMFCAIPVSGATGSRFLGGADPIAEANEEGTWWSDAIKGVTLPDNQQYTIPSTSSIAITVKGTLIASGSNATQSVAAVMASASAAVQASGSSAIVLKKNVNATELSEGDELVLNDIADVGKEPSDGIIASIEANGAFAAGITIPEKAQAGTYTYQIVIGGNIALESIYTLTLVEEEKPSLTLIDTVTITNRPSADSLKVDATHELGMTITPLEASAESNWISSDTTVATITNEGTVTALKAGTTKINLVVKGTGNYKGKATADFDLTVTPADKPAATEEPLASLVLETEVKLAVGESKTLDLNWEKVTPVVGKVTLDPASSEFYKMELSENLKSLKITALKEGAADKAKISYLDEAANKIYTDTFTVTVYAVTTSLNLDKNEVFLDRGDSADVTVTFEPENAKIWKWLPDKYIVTETGKEANWPTDSLITSSVVNGKFPDNKLTIKINENAPKDLAYGTVKMWVGLLKPDAVVAEGESPALEDILTKKEITIYFREKKAPVLPPVTPGRPNVDQIKDKLEDLDIDNMTLAEKKEVASEVLDSLAKQNITVKQTTGSATLAEDLKSVEDKLIELLGETVRPQTLDNSSRQASITFTGSLFSVPSGKTPALNVNDEVADANKISGMGVIAGSTPVALEIKLKTTDGSTISKLKVPMQLKIDASALGLDSTKKIRIKHIKGDGTSSMLTPKVEGTTLVFWVSDFSTFVFANVSASTGGSQTGGNGSSSSSGGGGGSAPAATTVSGNWRQDAGGWRFVYTNGAPAANIWIELTWNGKADWYHFNAQAYADGGWVQDAGHTYYLNPLHNGQFGMMMTGWQQIEGKWYYFQPQTGGPKGAMLKNTTTPDGFQVGEDGARK